MQINGLELPPDFVKDVHEGRFRRARGNWELIENCSTYGDPLETEIARVLESVTNIEKATGELEQDFCSISAEDIEGYNEICGIAPGEIPYIWDFSQIVCFAIAADGAPFCFDFRDNVENPRVIWWADAHWQLVAPDYQAFIALFRCGSSCPN